MTEPHRFDLRVYYEDTDAGGIVYYANYLKFTERARTEWLRALGVDQSALRAAHNLIFVVARIEGRYRRPALLDDRLTVETSILNRRSAGVALAQNVVRADEVLFEGVAEIVLIDVDNGRPQRPPAMLSALWEPAASA